MKMSIFRAIHSKTRQAFSVVHFGLLILKQAGPRVFVQKLKNQLCGHTVFLVTTRRLDEPNFPSSFECTVSQASPEEAEELFREIRRESPNGRYDLLVRKWYHDQGFGDCYITRAKDTNEICNVRWAVTPEHIRQLRWEARFPLEDDEVMLENVYTLERYRRKGVRTASASQAREIVKRKGFKRTKGYVEENNIQQLRLNQREGTKVSAKLVERHFLFRVTRETIERYNPPIPITLPEDKN
jgi:GNAT superfamily N-acetyltransferase